ncbi:hypothetical protein HMPREF0548_0384 [Lactobacillus ultunensis DSM 16047]|uniref:Uncharacterized protein n=1 Tax=Lactobacillus ultunensis DSM 16047 TaxID=525365 RepID=C2EL38_9LACO|nr:hypothetical protein HMPREF0548_0384 [Lactobacillus ultunensis DSM 16047]
MENMNLWTFYVYQLLTKLKLLLSENGSKFINPIKMKNKPKEQVTRTMRITCSLVIPNV